MRALSTETLDARWECLEAARIRYECVLLDRADPHTALDGIAAETDAELIVVGSCGANALTGVVVGGVGLYLAHHSTRPVAIVGRPCDIASAATA